MEQPCSVCCHFLQKKKVTITQKPPCTAVFNHNINKDSAAQYYLLFSCSRFIPSLSFSLTQAFKNKISLTQAVYPSFCAFKDTQNF